MKRIYLIIVLMVGLYFCSNSQNIPLSDQYLVNKFNLSPSFAGAAGTVDVFGNYRNQWKDFPGSPITKTINVNGPAFKNVGFGANLISDKTDIYNRFFASATYAYHLRLGQKQFLDFSLTGTAYQNNVDFAKLVAENPNDQVIAGAKVNNDLAFNAGAAILFRYNTFNIGFSVPYITRNRSVYSEQQQYNDYTLQRLFIVHANFDVKLGSNFAVEPFFVGRKTEFNPIGYDISVLFKYKDNFWLGGMYRDTKDIGLTAGFKLNDAAILSYTYEFGNNMMSKNAIGTHDFTIGFYIGKELKKTREEMQRKEKQVTQAIQNFQNQLNQEKKSTEGYNQKIDSVYKRLYELEKQVTDLKDELAKRQYSRNEQEPGIRKVDKIRLKEEGIETEAPANFYVVIESFSKKENAIRAKNNWKDKGYKPNIIYSAMRDKYYIVAGRFKSKAEADRFKKGIKAKGTDCWIYYMKKK